ncbi:PTS glucose transporter subunit IIA [Salipaludibacillus sp. LMS25]|uniref:PTS sugar transporter subunit IIA n=1 Tax=Salipaludibacillus sp. LMS25 TaxID=2924031 RepID=UPI0020D17B34|nr:PTS glucose transporter subunit IIA [Salipaludibacillus sp. LMS25]UTR14549.1 PTS glucose transporter subunit IIA [Salipaludibacillus sp. LMS25]
MFKKLFGVEKKPKTDVKLPKADGKDTILSPVNGEVLPLSEVPDPTFAKQMMGDGIAVMPSGGQVVSPVHGEIIQVFPTKHAVGLKTVNGIEILIHIGIETVNLQGEGFKAFVKEGSKVAPGDKLIEFDIDVVKEKAESLITPIIITNGEAVETLDKYENQAAKAGETAVMVLTSK